MAIVVRGLGLPEDGALVVGGLGVSEADPNAMFATLAGSSSLSAALTAGGSTPTVAGGSISTRRPRHYGYATRPIFIVHKATRAPIKASLSGSSLLTADITFTIDFDLDLETLLLAGVL